MKLSKRFVIYLLLPLVGGCSDDENATQAFDREAILVNAADQLIIPSYQAFQQRATTLHQQAEALIAAPSEANVIATRSAWQAAKLQWKAAEVYRFGPIEQLALTTAIDRWPASATGVEQAVAGYDGDATYLEGVGSNRRGLPAIEYLLYHADATQIARELQDERRREYLRLLTGALVEHTSAILQCWQHDYRDAFIANIGNEADASTTLLANQLIFLLEVVKNNKVGEPAGLTSTRGPAPDRVESPYAAVSLECIQANVDALEATFTGGEGVGFDDYLDALAIRDENSESLSELIQQQFEVVRTSLQRMDAPLSSTVLDEPQAVEQLYADLQRLNGLLKADMMSQLGLLVVFSDSDGD